MINLRLPNINAESVTGQIAQIKSYLYQLAEQLNVNSIQTNDVVISGKTMTIEQAIASVSPQNAQATFDSIKALIIKSADIVEAHYEAMDLLHLQGKYLAQSDFGTYAQETETRMSATESELSSTVTQVETIASDYGSFKQSAQTQITQNANSITLKADKTTAVSSVQVYYALSTSATVAPEDNWSTTAPAWENGKYMWQKTVTTYASGVTDESNPTCISGAKGEDGTSVTILGSFDTYAELIAAHPTGNRGDAYLVAGDLYVWQETSWQNAGRIQGPEGEAGRGVASIVPQYYLSTSATTQTGGQWSTTAPAWEPAHYIWTRSRITWSDGSKSNTTPALSNALNQFGADLTVQSDRITAEVTRATAEEGVLASRITQTADSITSEIERATAAEGTLSSRITQTASDLTSEISRAETAEAGLNTRIGANETLLTEHSTLIQQNADSIALKANQTALNALTGTVNDHTTLIQQNAYNIELKANQTALNALGTTVNSHTTQIQTNAQNILLKANQTALDSLGNVVSGHTSQLSIDAGKIALVVDANNSIKAASIVTAINNAGSSVAVSADKINFTGFTTFVRPSDLGSNGTTTIDGGRITTGAIRIRDVRTAGSGESGNALPPANADNVQRYFLLTTNNKWYKCLYDSATDNYAWYQNDDYQYKTKIDIDKSNNAVRLANFYFTDNSMYQGVHGNEQTWSKDGFFLATGTRSAYSIGGSPLLRGWCIGVGGQFGVTIDGNMYAKNAYLQGEINSNKGIVGGWNIDTSGLWFDNETTKIRAGYGQRGAGFYIFEGDEFGTNRENIIEMTQAGFRYNTENFNININPYGGFIFSQGLVNGYVDDFQIVHGTLEGEIRVGCISGYSGKNSAFISFSPTGGGGYMATLVGEWNIPQLDALAARVAALESRL